MNSDSFLKFSFSHCHFENKKVAKIRFSALWKKVQPFPSLGKKHPASQACGIQTNRPTQTEVPMER